MKTISILSTLIFLTVFAGCSDNLIGTNQPAFENTTNTLSSENPLSDNLTRKPELLWSLDEINVRASSETFVENKAIYNNPPFMDPEDYLITFDVFTDADENTNCYRPTVNIYMDEEVVYEAQCFPDLNPQGICHREINMDNVRFDCLISNISLSRLPLVPPEQNNAGCTLRLFNVKLYLLN